MKLGKKVGEAATGLAVEDVPLERMHEAPWNPRTISEFQLRALKESLQTYGAVEPVVLNADGMILGGHQRFAAAADLGWSSLPAVRVDLDERQAKVLNLALNRISGDWDETGLARVLSEVTEPGSEILVAGFDEDDVKEILARLDGPVATVAGGDDLPAEVEPRTNKGDLWLLGEHRLLCGDATNAEDVVNYDPEWRNVEAEKGNLAYAARRVGKVTNDDRSDWSAAWALTPSDVLYSWHPAGAPSLVHAKALQDSGFEIRMQIIWAKSNFPIGRGDYHVRHEPCWYAVRKGKASKRTKDRTQTTLWEVDLDANVAGGMSTQKPLECMARPIRNHELSEVYDPFCGSGTTLIAAETLERTCYAMEIDPHYCDVIVQRWTEFTDEEARRG